MSLYSLPLDFAMLYRQLEESEGEITPELEAQFDELMAEGKDRIEAGVCVMRNLLADSEKSKAESDFFAARAKRQANQAERLKALILNLVQQSFGGEVKTDRFTVKAQLSAKQFTVELAPDADMEKFAAMYPSFVRTTPPVLAKDVLKAAVREHHPLPPEIAVIEIPQTHSLRVK